MKAIIEKRETYEITGERGDFFITKSNRGKVKMFAKKDVEVIEIDSMPKAKKYSKGRVPSEASHKRFMEKIREAEFQDNYLECQRSTKY